MEESYLVISLLCLFLFTHSVHSKNSSPEVLAMQALKISLGNPRSLHWSNSDPCKWRYVKCLDNRVTDIKIGNLNLKGSLPPGLQNLSSLTVLDVDKNQLTGPIPSLNGLTSLREVNFSNNKFSCMPSDFFKGLKSIRSVALDNNPFAAWELPQSLKDATSLQFFTASHSNIAGTIPDFFGRDTFPGLINLRLAKNKLQGQLPPSFANSSVHKLWLYGQKFNGSVAVLQNMTNLTHLCLDANSFSGPLPILSGLNNLVHFSVRQNQLTGTVPLSLVNLPKLTTVHLADNFFQGPTPEFKKSKAHVDIDNGSNSFCLGDPGVACDSQVNFLLSISESVGYPVVFAQSWKGNHPCNASQGYWKGISCDGEGNITVVNFNSLGLSGTISSIFSELRSLKELILSNNSLTGSIPTELTTLPSLERLDVSDNQLDGIVPNFRSYVIVNIDGNPDIKIIFPPLNPPLTPAGPDSRGNNLDFRKIVTFIIGAVCGVCALGLGVYLYTRKPKCPSLIHSTKPVEIHPPGGNTAKITLSINEVEFGNMIIPIQVLRCATNNFSEENILGRGGFGTVYRGMLQDGTKIAVKRMKSRTFREQCLASFKSEIEVLTKVRHRHLLTLLGYSLGGNERLLVYEYMPQGTLSRHLFKWEKEGLKPLEWHRRLIIALDVARGVEYLHGLANQSFIHRDLKPSNILLGDDMRAKVADFGLARLVPENLKSIETRVAGTFGYLAPEYVVTGRVTKKVDVFSFGVILMELITGRKAVDATHYEDIIYLVTWFRNMQVDDGTFRTAIDQTIELDEESFTSIVTMAELADHCCASEHQQRPEMGQVVNVLSSLVELWRPTKLVYDKIDL